MSNQNHTKISLSRTAQLPVASFTKEVNPWLAKRPLKTNGRLANLGLTSVVKKATYQYLDIQIWIMA